MAKEIIVKGYRRSEDGKTFEVKPYKRRVGFKGIFGNIGKPKSAPANKPTVPQTPVEDIYKPPTTKSEAEAWDAAYRKKESKRISDMFAHVNTSEPKYLEIDEKQRDMFDRAEDKIAKFVEKYTKQKYKRML